MSNIHAQLKAIAAKSMVKAEKVIKETYFDVMNEGIIGTPVLDGLLISSYNAGFEVDTSYPNEPRGLHYSTDRLTIALENDRVLSETFYMTNSQPYAFRIEYEGHSANAPQGMIRKAAANFNTIAAMNINKYKG